LGKPAARVGDLHNCPRISPNGLPHAGGPIVGGGCTTVWIEGRLAATAGDVCLCTGDVDEIKTGSTGVYIEGRQAARQGDHCAHGGVVVGGSGTVEIGERLGTIFFSRPVKSEKNEDDFIEPSKEEKERIINQAIQECIILLERKLKLLENKDPKTMDDFKKWFGWVDVGAVDLILNRIRRALDIAKVLTLDNFGVIEDEHDRMNSYALAHSNYEFHDINLGDLFWNDEKRGGKSNGSIIAHELSHFEYVGGTWDFDYGIKQCNYLVENLPELSLYNADNFEFFIKG
jgi:uncharacterized Zn-binding protein involved in type VI secretion